jgi:hypothetical protein
MVFFYTLLQAARPPVAAPVIYTIYKFTAQRCQSQYRFSSLFAPITAFLSPSSQRNVNFVIQQLAAPIWLGAVE